MTKYLPLLLLFRFQGTLGMTITNNLSNSSPRLGETITLRCNIAGGTARSVTWWKDKHRSPGAVPLTHQCSVVPKKYKSLRNVRCDMNNYNFKLDNVQISDRGEYVCEADGKVAKTTLRLDILVPPLTPTVTNRSPVNVGDTAILTCDAENVHVTKPVSYTWTKDGKTLSRTNERGSLLITPVAVGHAGKYVCVAKNVAGSKASTKQDLVVYSRPSAPSQLVVISITAEAVTLKWVSEFNGGYEQRYYIQYKKSAENWNDASEVPQGGIPDPGLKKVVYHRVMDLESNFRYQFRVRSKISHHGTHYASNFSIIASGITPGPPSAPSKLEVINTTAVAVTLKWISESNGGYEQRFYVQYKQSAESWDVALEVPQAGIIDPGLKKVVYHRVMYLESNVWYLFRVRSKNSHPGTHHTSNFSNIASGKTSADEVNAKSNSNVVDSTTNTSVLAVGGAVGTCIIVAIAVVSVAVVLWKRALARFRRRHRRTNDTNDTKDDDDTRISENQRHVNDTADYDDTIFELGEVGNSAVQNISASGVPGNEPANDNVDEDAYDYMDSPTTRTENAPGQNSVPVPQENQVGYAFEQNGQHVSVKNESEQEQHEPEGTDKNVLVLIHGQPAQSMRGCDSSQANVAHRRPSRHSNNDTVHGQESQYEQLDPVEALTPGKYLDLRELSKSQ